MLVETTWPIGRGPKAARAFFEAHPMDPGRRPTLDIDVLLEGV